MGRQCERCTWPTTAPNERFCKYHRAEELQKLRESGEYRPVPWDHHRSGEQKENTNETKHGTDW